MLRTSLAWTLVLASGLSCERATAAQPAASSDVGVSAAAVDPVAAADTPAASPFAGLRAPDPEHASLTGTVVERLSAGRYTYLQIDVDGVGRWVATTGEGASVGQLVRVRSFGSRRDFESPRLGRRFDELVFGSVVLAEHPVASPTSPTPTQKT
ncbi:MAG: hypothetical protein IAG13_20515 [Deltaproteobacteria bacterium]|nr:hypothetical protein [Nannocystaceae bacterium]